VKSLLAVLVLVPVIVIGARTASAQPGATEPIPPGAMEPPPIYAQPQQQPQVAQKSESTALWLSLGGTIGSYALLFAPAVIANSGTNEATTNLAASAATVGLVGTLLAPTFGHWYAGKGFTRGFGLRLGSIGVALLGAVVALSGCSISFGHDQQDDPDCGQGAPIGIALLIGAGGMWVGGTVDDIVQAPRRVRRRNEAAVQLGLTPIVHGDRAGIVLVGSF